FVGLPGWHGDVSPRKSAIQAPIAALGCFGHSRSKSEGSHRMRHCDEHSTDILFYLDNALTGQNLEDYRAHLAHCSDCRKRLQEELALWSLLHAQRQLYLAPHALRTRVAADTTQQAPAGSLLSGL